MQYVLGIVCSLLMVVWTARVLVSGAIAGQPVDKPKTAGEEETNVTIRLAAGGRKSAQAAENWPQFRGPLGDGHCEAEGLPLEWSETTNVKWRTAIHDQGWSSPVIWDNQVWMTTATADGKRLYAVCVDRETGKIAHDIRVFDVQQPQEIWGNKNGHASPTPVIEAGYVYVHIAKGAPSIASCLLVRDLLYLVSDPGIISCVDATSGAIVWKERLQGTCRASSICADGRIYVPNVNGVTTVIEPGRRFNVLAVNELGDRTRLEASFAVAGRALFVRTETHLYRIED